MERGDSVVKTAVLSGFVIVAIAAVVISLSNTPTASVVYSDDFIGNPSGTLCQYLACANFRPAYYLGDKIGQMGIVGARCCCPENYQGDQMCNHEVIMLP